MKVGHLGAGYAVAGGVKQPHLGRMLGVIALELQEEGVTCHITNASHVTPQCVTCHTNLQQEGEAHEGGLGFGA